MRTILESGRALQQAREQTDALFRIVRPDSLYERPIPERHRIVFYLGHLEAFDWNLIARYALDVPAFHAEFDQPVRLRHRSAARRNCRATSPRIGPSSTEVERYNRRTREVIDDLVDEVPEQLLHVAIEHRLMHAETFAYILHQLAYDEEGGAAPGRPGRAGADGASGRTHASHIPGGAGHAGPDTADGAFGWDNEFQAHTVEVPPFSHRASTK